MKQTFTCDFGEFKFNVALLHSDHKDYLGRGTQNSHLDFHTVPELCYQIQVQVQCCFTSKATTRTIRDGEPRTTTSTFTQLLIPEDFGELCFVLLFMVAWVKKEIPTSSRAIWLCVGGMMGSFYFFNSFFLNLP